MSQRWIIIIYGAAFSPFLFFVFVVIIYNNIMTIQLRVNNIYNNNHASAIHHNNNDFRSRFLEVTIQKFTNLFSLNFTRK